MYSTSQNARRLAFRQKGTCHVENSHLPQARDRRCGDRHDRQRLDAGFRHADRDGCGLAGSGSRSPPVSHRAPASDIAEVRSAFRRSRAFARPWPHGGEGAGGRGRPADAARGRSQRHADPAHRRLRDAQRQAHRGAPARAGRYRHSAARLCVAGQARHSRRSARAFLSL